MVFVVVAAVVTAVVAAAVAAAVAVAIAVVAAVGAVFAVAVAAVVAAAVAVVVVASRCRRRVCVCARLVFLVSFCASSSKLLHQSILVVCSNLHQKTLLLLLLQVRIIIFE